jgi:hypothetical protein
MTTITHFCSSRKSLRAARALNTKARLFVRSFVIRHEKCGLIRGHQFPPVSPESIRQFFERNCQGLALAFAVVGHYALLILGWHWVGVTVSAIFVYGTLALVWLVTFTALWASLGSGSTANPTLVRIVSLGQAFCLFVMIAIWRWISQDAYFRRLFHRHHLLIFGVTSVVATAELALMLVEGDPEEFMDGSKTFPMLSPLLCFGAPATWKDTLTKFGVTNVGLKIPAILLFISGFTFISAMLLFWKTFGIT